MQVRSGQCDADQFLVPITILLHPVIRFFSDFQASKGAWVASGFSEAFCSPAHVEHAPPCPADRCCSDRPGFMIFSQCIRLGEAYVPGPKDIDPDKWAIGAINPTGLAGKSVLFADMPPGVYAISESHLTARGKARFKQELFFAKSAFKFTGGHDAPYKKDNLRAVGGKHTGVGFLSTFPCRPIQWGWDQALYSTGRIHAATFQVREVAVAGGVYAMGICPGFRIGRYPSHDRSIVGTTYLASSSWF